MAKAIQCADCHRFVSAEKQHSHPKAQVFHAGDIIRPQIIGRGVRSYLVLDGDTVQRINVQTHNLYGIPLPITSIAPKAQWTLEGHTKSGICPDLVQERRTASSHNDWMHGWNK